MKVTLNYDPTTKKKRTIFEAENVNDAVSCIKYAYINSDVCMGEFLATAEIKGLTIDEVVQVYARLYNEFEGDEICRVDEDGNRYSIVT